MFFYVSWNEVAGHPGPRKTGNRVIRSILNGKSDSVIKKQSMIPYPLGAMLPQRYSAALCSAG